MVGAEQDGIVKFDSGQAVRRASGETLGESRVEVFELLLVGDDKRP